MSSRKQSFISMLVVLLAIGLVSGSVMLFFSESSPLKREDAPQEQSSSMEDENSPQAVPTMAQPGEQSENDEEPGDPSEEAEQPAANLPVHFNTPGEMRGVFLTPGVDFFLDPSATEEKVKGEIDKALADAKALTMNSVIIDTVYADKVIYHTQHAPRLADFDAMEYLVQKAREHNFYTYAIFDASHYQQSSLPSGTLSIGADTINQLSVNLREFAESYQLDGILIDGYQNQSSENSYGLYLTMGGAIGYDNYMRQSAESVIRTASRTIRTYARGTQVGLLADSVWENKEQNEEGSNTAVSFTALGTANADTKSFVEEELVDFVAVKAYSSLTSTTEPFKEVVSWWSGIASQGNIPLYVVHASDKICTEQPGWEAHDQLTKQVIESEEFSSYRGSMFNNLTRMVDDPKEATSTLIKYYNNEVEAAHILTELQITKPEQTTYTTFEPLVTFTGASDPNSAVTINDVEIPTDASGYFTVTYDLEPGQNTYTIVHKEKTIIYNITRQVQVLKEMSPMGSIAAEGSMTITISAMAYSDAQVYATVNGTTVPMVLDEESVEDESDRDSSYKLFVGEYTTPAATSEEQNLGNIMVYGSWEGQQDSIQGASIKVNKRAQIENGVPVVITAAQARTYPPNTLNNIPSNIYYPLPRGTMDYAVGDEIVYKKGSDVYRYYVLASELRVSSDDMQVSSDYPSGNSISGMSVRANNSYTYVTLKTAQKVAYTFKYASGGVSISFHYTDSVTKDLSLDQNPLFTSAKWNDSTLTLNFVKENGFIGYRAYYDDEGNLVFRFNNPPTSIKGAKIAIDPGHGGSDPGGLGFLAEYPERVINRAIAKELATELESRGATVLLIDTSKGMSLQGRVDAAEQFGAHFYVSIHNNTASRSSAVGTEVYYFYPYSRTLATRASARVANALNTTNRGSRYSYYHVTLSSQFPSVLVECGFMTNKSEYEKLIKSKNQKRIATGVADALEEAIKAARTGFSATGEQSVGSAITTGGTAEESTSSSSGGDITFTDPGSSSDAATVTGSISLNRSSLTLEEGATYTLQVTTDDSVTWSSGNTAVATVNSDGVVTAHREGTAKITATTDNGESATCTVEVVEQDDLSGFFKENKDEDDGDEGLFKKAVNAQGVYFLEDSITVARHKTYPLIIDSDIGRIDPLDFAWKSKDTKIATVDENGVVTGKNSGMVEITATGKSYWLSCIVTVST